MNPGLVRQRNALNYLSLRASSQEYFWPWANVESSELRQIAQLPMINKGIVIFKHVVWEPINNQSVAVSCAEPQLDQGFVPRNKRMENQSCVCCAGLANKVKAGTSGSAAWKSYL